MSKNHRRYPTVQGAHQKRALRFRRNYQLFDRIWGASLVNTADFARFGEYLMTLLAASAEVMQEREASLRKKYPHFDTTNDYKSDEDYHEYVMSIGAYELLSRIVEVYGTISEPSDRKLPLSSMN